MTDRGATGAEGIPVLRLNPRHRDDIVRHLLRLPAEDRRLRFGLPAEPRWARITLTVHSDLAAVGMMAAVAAELASAGIPVNPVAGWFHDHLLVPWDRREEAVRRLEQLAARASATR